MTHVHTDLILVLTFDISIILHSVFYKSTKYQFLISIGFVNEIYTDFQLDHFAVCEKLSADNVTI